jgi:hypothetical protein
MELNLLLLTKTRDLANDFNWLDGYKSTYRLWTTYSVALLQAIRAEIVTYERWNELPIIDKIIAQKVVS